MTKANNVSSKEWSSLWNRLSRGIIYCIRNLKKTSVLNVNLDSVVELILSIETDSLILKKNGFSSTCWVKWFS